MSGKLIDCPSCKKPIEVPFPKIPKDKPKQQIDTSPLNIPKLQRVLITPTVQWLSLSTKPYIKVIVLLLILVTVIYGYRLYAVHEFLTLGRAAVIEMTDGAATAETLCATISGIWSFTISYQSYIDDKRRRWVSDPTGPYPESSGDSPEELIRETLKKSEDVPKIYRLQKVVEINMKKIGKPPMGYDLHYRKLLELYGEYCKFCNMATNPSGSLMTYNQSVKEEQEKLIQLLNELKILYK